jgi:hypothetical protein
MELDDAVVSDAGIRGFAAGRPAIEGLAPAIAPQSLPGEAVSPRKRHGTMGS